MNSQSERGQTLLIVAVSLLSILAIAALAVDVVSLFVARNEVQRAADAAALAGAKMFVLSGFTSGQLGSMNSSTVQGLVCENSGGVSRAAANQQATYTAQQNLVGGQIPSVTNVSCNFSTPENPQITVTVQKTNLPVYFAKIWRFAGASASASATAEAFNPSGSTGPAIGVSSTKPWLLPNCNPEGSGCTPGFFFSGPNNSISNPANFIATPSPLSLNQLPNTSGTASGGYYVIAQPASNVCPVVTSPPPGSCTNVESSPYQKAIACAGISLLHCGDTVAVQKASGSMTFQQETQQGIQCLIHAAPVGLAANACHIGGDQDCFESPVPGQPVVIDGGLSNTNPALRGVSNISRSDSVVILPVYDGVNVPCANGQSCDETVIGFLQFGIVSFDGGGKLTGYFLNASGCGANGTTGIFGGGLNSIPVRLIHQ
jgi:hypothetical protein